MKKYEEYQESGIEWLGKVPAHWEIKSLKYLLSEPMMYGANEAAELDDINLPRYIRITDFGNDGNLRSGTFKSLPHELAKDYLLKEGDILFARSGATVGKTFFFKGYEGQACFAGYLIKGSFNFQKVLPEYVYYFTKSGMYENWKNSIFIQSTIQNISAEKYKALAVSVPPLPEQHVIAAYLDRKTAQLDTLLAQKEALLQKLHQKRQALINEAVTQGLDQATPRKPSGVAWLGDVPAHWDITQLKHVTDFINGAPFKPENWIDEGIPIVRIQNLNGNANFNCIDPQTEVKESCHLHGGELLFSWSGNVGTSFGPFMWEREGLSYLNQHIFRLDNYQLHQKYFYWLLKAVTKYIESKTHGIIGMVHVTKPELGAVPIPKISFQEQEEIANYLDHKMGQIDEVSKAIHTQIQTLKTYRQSLISEVVTGKVDVRTAVTHPEADLPLWQQ